MTNEANKMYPIEVIKMTGLNKTVKSIRMRLTDRKDIKDFTFIPGQFIMLGILGYNEAPLTITTTQKELPEFEVAVRSEGIATQAMQRLKVGDKLYFRGPFGNNILNNQVYGKQVVLVAGGIGLAPLRSFINTIRDDKTIVGDLKLVYGAKTPEELIYKGELGAWGKFADVQLIVDKADRDWNGQTGRVTDVLNKMKLDKDAVAIVCGPPVMYKPVAAALKSIGLADETIMFMLERRMKCGIGKCQHCTCGEKYVCIDGPTFAWSEIKDNFEVLR